MPRAFNTLTLDDAKRMIAAAEAEADRIGLPYNVAVVDAGANLIAFARQDGSLIGSVELAISKARTARIYDKSTADLAVMARPGHALYGIEHASRDPVVVFAGGLPVSAGGMIIGAVGASAGTIEQDAAVAAAAIAALGLTAPNEGN